MGRGYKGPQEDDGPQVDVGDKMVNFWCGLFTQKNVKFTKSVSRKRGLSGQGTHNSL